MENSNPQFSEENYVFPLKGFYSLKVCRIFFFSQVTILPLFCNALKHKVGLPFSALKPTMAFIFSALCFNGLAFFFNLINLIIILKSRVNF